MGGGDIGRGVFKLDGVRCWLNEERGLEVKKGELCNWLLVVLNFVCRLGSIRMEFCYLVLVVSMLLEILVGLVFGKWCG